MASAVAFSSAAVTCRSRMATPSLVSAAKPVRSLAPLARRNVLVRAEKSGLDKLVEQVEDKAQDFVEATKENSGLDMDKLGKQPGNEDRRGNVKTEEFSFAGLLPETINSRAAMLGMLTVWAAELRTGTPLFVQIQQAPLSIAATFAIIIIASVIPVARGIDFNATQGAGPFTHKAEIWNGRTAMVAFAFLILVETWKAGPGLVL
jgi:hypothetical protein